MSAAEVLHRIELREGTAEPAVLDLTPGRQIGPIDVGAMGHWRVIAEGVADKHVYLFFDGARLFLQCAGPGTPVFANGQPLPFEWTAVEPPCEIAIGKALLFYRPSDKNSDRGIVDENTDDDDPLGMSTRVVPVEELMARTAATRRAGLNLPPPSIPTPTSGVHHVPRPTPPPVSSRRGLPQEDAATFGTATVGIDPDARGSQRGMNGPPASMPTPTGALPEPSQRGMDAPPPSANSFGPDPSEPMRPQQMSPFGMEHGGTREGPPAKRPTLWQSMSFPQKAIAFLFVPMVLSLVVIFTDIVPTVMKGTGTKTKPSSSAPPATASAPEPPAEIDEPDILPERTALPPAPLASVSGSAAVSGSGSASAAPIGSAPPVPAEPVEDPETAKNKSMQRRAVDALHEGAYEEAAELYEALAKKYPDNKAYAAAAAITRAKAGAGK